jgi:uncharacterized protein involved in exopolysaccharide biosynthesis
MNSPSSNETSQRAEASGREPAISVMLPQSLLRAEADDIDLLEVARSIWKSRYALMGFVTLAIACATAYAFVARPWYRAEAVLMVAQSRTAAGLSTQFGSLASLAGLKVAGAQDVEPVAVLQSRQLITEYIQEQNLLPELFSESWDSGAGAWKGDDAEVPDVLDGVELFTKKVLEVVEDPKTGLVTLSVEWTDPVRAAQWTRGLVTKINEGMREREIQEALENINYLRAELASTDVVVLQQSISRLIEAEMQRLMLARGNDEFAFRIIDRAEVPKRHVRPRRLLVVVGTGIVALVGACIVIAIGVLIRPAPPSNW